MQKEQSDWLNVELHLTIYGGDLFIFQADMSANYRLDKTTVFWSDLAMDELAWEECRFKRPVRRI